MFIISYQYNPLEERKSLMEKFQALLQDIKELRTECKFTQAEVAQKIGVSFRTYQRMESGESSLAIDQLHKILSLFKPKSNVLIGKYFSHSADENSYGDYHFFQLSNENKMLSKPATGRPVLEVEMIKDLYSRTGYSKKDKNVGYWEWNLSLKELYWSEEMFQIHGFDFGSQVPLSYLKENLSAESWDSIENKFKRLAVKSIPFFGQYLIKKLNGDEIHIEVTARRYHKDIHNIILFGIVELI